MFCEIHLTFSRACRDLSSWKIGNGCKHKMLGRRFCNWVQSSFNRKLGSDILMRRMVFLNFLILSSSAKRS